MADLIARMREAREKPSVTKLRIAKFRSAVGDTPIFAFEGPDDKLVFSRWIERIDSTKFYEPFVCNGKRESRNLSHVIEGDLGNLGRISIFVDRDFDDLEGFAAIESIFMTDRYSIESYFADRSHLEKILKDDLGCNGRPAIRARVLEAFDVDFETFLTSSRAINHRMFVAKRCKIERSVPPPKAIDFMVELAPAKTKALPYHAPDILPLENEPSQSAYSMLTSEFAELEPAYRYRGKFIFKFLVNWLTKLQRELKEGEGNIIAKGDDIDDFRGVDLSMVSLSSRSPMPKTLAQFIHGV